jgi:hypothetical protein
LSMTNRARNSARVAPRMGEREHGAGLLASLDRTGCGSVKDGAHAAGVCRPIPATLAGQRFLPSKAC